MARESDNSTMPEMDGIIPLSHQSARVGSLVSCWNFGDGVRVVFGIVTRKVMLDRSYMKLTIRWVSKSTDSLYYNDEPCRFIIEVQ